MNIKKRIRIVKEEFGRKGLNKENGGSRKNRKMGMSHKINFSNA